MPEGRTSSILIVASLAALGAFSALVTMFSNVSALEFSFDPNGGYPLSSQNFTLPVLLIGLVSLGGIFIIAGERKKAKGIWFTNKENLR
ncbi:MAG: hypothetical protein ABI361_12970 [Nitrososphaera sp.]